MRNACRHPLPLMTPRWSEYQYCGQDDVQQSIWEADGAREPIRLASGSQDYAHWMDEMPMNGGANMACCQQSQQAWR